MAKPIITKYNPVELLQSNSVYEPLNGFFFERLKNFEDLIQYPQKYQNSDTLVLQFQTEAAATFDVKLVSDANSYNLTTSALTPPISYVGTNLFYKSSLALTSVAEGIYYVRVKITTDKIYYFVSEPICIKATHENTILFKYTHDLNQYNTLFQTSTTPNYFYLRVEGGIKTSQFEQGSTDEIFIDQNYNSIQLDGETYNIYNFLFGSGIGLPYWMAEKLNRIMILYEFYIDGKRFKKNQGTKFECIEIIDENYPLCNYKVELLPEQTDVLDEIHEIPIVNTYEATIVKFITATLNGEVISEGDYPVIERGFYLSENSDVNKEDVKYTASGSGIGVFYYDLENLKAGQNYYYRAYAKTIKGIAVGEVKTFLTTGYNYATIESLNNGDEYFVKIYVKTGETADFTIDWGDGRSNIYSLDDRLGGHIIKHYYPKGLWDVKIIADISNYSKFYQIIGDYYYMQCKQLSINIHKYYNNLADIWVIDQLKLVNAIIAIEALTDIKQIFLKNQKLNELSVNNILINADSALINPPYTDVIINLSGEISQSAAPTGAGLVAKASLISKGVEVYTE